MTKELEKMNTLTRLWQSGRIAGVMIISLTIWACAINQSTVHRPLITLANIQIREISTFETILRIDLKVENVKSDVLVIEGLDYTIKINGVLFASGLTNSPMEIPAKKSSTLPIIINASLMELINTSKNRTATDRINYEITGHLQIKESGLLEPPRIPFNSEGELALATRK
jgi:LEA14-like dessication related protein